MATWHDEPVRLEEARGRWVLLATVLGSGMAMLDGTVVNIALPALGRDLDAGFAGLQWTVNGYTLTLASLILLGGSLGDRYGRRRVFVVGTVWFAAASLLCALAPTTGLLVAARMLQGVGGALLTPGSLAIISASLPPGGPRPGDRGLDRARRASPARSARSSAVRWSTSAGGWCSSSTCRWPPRSWSPSPSGTSRRPATTSRSTRTWTWLGALLGTVGLAGTTYALVAYGGGGWTAGVLAAGAAGVLGLLAFVLVERRSRHPMLPVDIFADRQFTAANLVTFAVYGALSGAVLPAGRAPAGGRRPLPDRSPAPPCCR